MTEEFAMEWVKVLKSDRFKQGTGQLFQRLGGKEYHCCLGVANRVGGIPLKDWEEDGDLSIDAMFRLGFYNLSGKPKLGKVLGFESLAEANDSGISFSIIADWIKVNWRDL